MFFYPPKKTRFPSTLCFHLIRDVHYHRKLYAFINEQSFDDCLTINHGSETNDI